MDLIAIIVFIIIILVVLIMAYIPLELQEQAKKAGFSPLSLRFLILKIQKVNYKFLFQQFEKLADNEINEDFDELVDIWKSNQKNTESAVRILIEGKVSGKSISLSDISAYKISENNHKRFIKILDFIEDPETDIEEEKLIRLINSDIDIPVYFKLIKIAGENNFKYTDSDIYSENLNDLYALYLNMKAVKDKGIKSDDIFLQDKSIDLISKAEILSTIIELNKSGISLKFEDLIALRSAGVYFAEFIESITLLKEETQLKISEDQLINHYLEGGKALRVIKFLKESQKQNIIINPELLFKLDIEEKGDFEKITANCINPYEFELSPPVKVLLENGLQISPQIIIKARDNINSKTFESEKDNQIKQINSIISSEFEKYSSHTDILKNKKKISKKIESEVLDNNVLKNLYESFKVNITDIDIIKDTLEELKKSEAKETEEKEKLKLLKAKRKLEEDMAKAVEKGKLNYNDYLKEKYIFNDDDKDLPYHTD